MLLILLVQAKSFVQSSLLLKCGDIESNPGPRIYHGKFCSVLPLSVAYNLLSSLFL